MAAIENKKQHPGIGVNLARLGRCLAFFGVRFSKPGHNVLRSGREADLSMCSPRLIEGMLMVGQDSSYCGTALQGLGVLCVSLI